MKFDVTMVWLESGKEEVVQCDGYALRLQADVIAMQFGVGPTVRWRVEHLSQFRSINVESNGESLQ